MIVVEEFNIYNNVIGTKQNIILATYIYIYTYIYNQTTSSYSFYYWSHKYQSIFVILERLNSGFNSIHLWKENLYYKRFTHRYIKFHPGQDSRCYPDYSQRWRGRQLREYVFLELAFRCWPRATFHRSAWISKCLWSWPGHHRGRTHSEYARLLIRLRWNHVHDRRCTELNHLPRVFWTGRQKKCVNGKTKHINL